MKKVKKAKGFSFNFLDIILSLLIIGFTVVSFMDFGNKLHYLAVIIGLGGVENLLLGFRLFRSGLKGLGILFSLLAIGLLVVCSILSFEIWW